MAADEIWVSHALQRAVSGFLVMQPQLPCALVVSGKFLSVDTVQWL